MIEIFIMRGHALMIILFKVSQNKKPFFIFHTNVCLIEPYELKYLVKYFNTIHYKS